MMKRDFNHHRHHIDQLIQAALDAADPYQAVKRVLTPADQNGTFLINNQALQIGPNGRLILIACGKAALPMAHAAVEVLGERIHSGAVVSKKGQQGTIAHPKIQVLFAAHPVADESSVTAGKLVFEMVSDLGPEDTLLFLISGGASALISRPLLPLDEWQTLNEQLLASGCTIQELNTVRQQLDQIKGGGLREAAGSAWIFTLILSDVVGNPLDKIGSGPTIPIQQNAADALAVLERYGIPMPVGLAELVSARRFSPQTSGKNGPGETVIVGDVRLAGEAAVRQARELGFDAEMLTWHLEGEAREIGRFAAALARSATPGRCWVLGGESTVTLRGDGLGGRNLEIALAAALALEEADGEGVIVATLATDGDDGPTGAAGGIVSGRSVTIAAAQGGDPAELLANNNSFHFFSRYLPDDLIITGQTGTNVNDLIFILKYPPQTIDS
ncbi:MAG: DUF4147 domain-containing protein [Ardenticatenaceae bacterium]|nr:DUF4147 domain-containing protein [Ardenticatenaceae bacterium]